MNAADAAVVDGWWRSFVATGALPAELEPVQSRLIRAVHRGQLPSGPVYVKTMTFPRGKDRLRYVHRALPGAHEAWMLAAVAAAGVPCPEVVAVHTARRWGLPFRSLLVLRALPVVAETAAPAARLRDEAALALRLLEAGVEHRDLHGDNFVRLADGQLAVLDLQSAVRHHTPCTGAKARVAAAARLLRDRSGAERGSADELLAAGLLRTAAEVAGALALAARDLAAFQRARLGRCLGETTEFTRRVRWSGLEHRVRGGLPPGRWSVPLPQARAAWLGQRARFLADRSPPPFPAYLRRWWGAGRLFVPATVSDAEIGRLAAAAAAWVGRPTA